MKIVIGMTGSGKSLTRVPFLVDLAVNDDHENRKAIYISDPHGTMGWEVARHVTAAGHGHRIVYDPLSETVRPLCWNWLSRSKAADRDQQELEEADYINGLLDFASFTRGEEQLHTRPWILKWSVDALKLLCRQLQQLPLTDVLFAFRTRHLRFRELIQGCWDDELRWEFHDLSRSRDKQREARAAELFLAQVIKNPLICKREGSFEVEESLREGKIVIVDGRGVNPEVRRVGIGCRNLAVLAAINRGVGRDCVYVQDEAQDYLTKWSAAAAAQLRKYRLEQINISQSPAFNPVIANSIFQNSEQEWFLCGSADIAAIGARHLLGYLKKDKVGRYEDRWQQFHDGWEDIERGGSSESVSRDEDGDGKTRISHGETINRSERQKFRIVNMPMPVIESGREQLFWLEQLLESGLAVGERFVRDRFGVRREYVPLLEDPYPCCPGLSEERTIRMLEELRQTPLYGRPTEKPQNSHPKRTGKGMRKSSHDRK